MGAKAAFDVATSLKPAGEEWRDNRAPGACCQAATLASVASLLLALPEAGRGLRGGFGPPQHPGNPLERGQALRAHHAAKPSCSAGDK